MESIESTLQFGHNQHIDLTMNTSIDIKRQLDTIIDKQEYIKKNKLVYSINSVNTDVLNNISLQLSKFNGDLFCYICGGNTS